MSRLVATHVVPAHHVDTFLRPRSGLVDETAAGDGRFGLARGPFTRYERTVQIGPADPSAPLGRDGKEQVGAGDAPMVTVTETFDYQLAVPVWGVLFARPVRRRLRQGPPRPGDEDDGDTRDGHDSDAIGGDSRDNDTNDGAALPRQARPAWWMPPDHLDARAATVLSLLCVFSVVAGYLGTLLTQTNTYIKADFGSTDGQIGTMQAVVRIGALLALAVIALADRRGRRWVLLASALAGCAITATGALAPNLVWLGLSQTVARAFATALILVVSIIAVEEMPAGSRAFAVSLLTASAALGAGICVMLLAVTDLGPAAWRLLYVVPLAAVPAVVRLGRRIPETKRFSSRAAPAPAPDRDGEAAPARSRWRLPEGLDRGRLVLLSASGLALALFAVPASAFLNEYLRTERHFSTGMVIVFQLATNTPGGLGIVVGGKLADRRGRRVVGAFGVAAGVGLSVATYLLAGWSIWVLSLLGSIFGAMAVPALGVYGPELFPTHLRGWANGVINLFTVVGSAVGLFLAGYLSDALSSLGPAMAILAIGPVVVIALVLLRYPETASLELEQLNPDDAPVAREMLALDGLDIVPQSYSDPMTRQTRGPTSGPMSGPTSGPPAGPSGNP